jgi:tetratricopeptide (TPR) repeat protein
LQLRGVEDGLGFDLYFARRYDDAAAETRKAIDLHPENWYSYFILGQIYTQQGRLAEAIAAQQKAREKLGVPDPMLPQLARTYALAGREAEARLALSDLLANARRQYVSNWMIALGYAAVGDKAQALSHLEQAYQDRSCFLAFLKVDPAMDSLRSEPRFQDLTRRMNFPQ